MAVGGIHDSLYDSYRVQQALTTYVDKPERTDSRALEADPSKQTDLNAQSDNLTSTTEPARIDKAGRMADLEQVSLTFNKEDSFGYIGMDSDPENLDMQKAISDMRKDQILQNYQYFVGSAGSLYGGMPTEDGMVVLKS